ncbi:MAG: transposase [Hyphomicrobiales bacterium]|nr:MAG: transposase [Hyphomicrobiales bacterium]
MNADRFWLTDPKFPQIELHLSTDAHGRPGDDDGRVISGIVHFLKRSGRWIDAPPGYGPAKVSSWRRGDEPGRWPMHFDQAKMDKP